MFRGVAARALHLSRGVEKPSGRVTYIVVLEGLCRFSVQELSARGSYHVARVSRLDLTKTGKIFNLKLVSFSKFYSTSIIINSQFVAANSHIFSLESKTIS
jgi:hypothetical protein